jgi:hypothetical protein
MTAGDNGEDHSPKETTSGLVVVIGIVMAALLTISILGYLAIRGPRSKLATIEPRSFAR